MHQFQSGYDFLNQNLRIRTLINAGCKWLKAFLASEVRKLSSLIAPIFDIRVDLLDFLFSTNS